jgi:hypothetical protein
VSAPCLIRVDRFHHEQNFVPANNLLSVRRSRASTTGCRPLLRISRSTARPDLATVRNRGAGRPPAMEP